MGDRSFAPGPTTSAGTTPVYRPRPNCASYCLSCCAAGWPESGCLGSGLTGVDAASPPERNPRSGNQSVWIPECGPPGPARCTTQVAVRMVLPGLVELGDVCPESNACNCEGTPRRTRRPRRDYRTKRLMPSCWMVEDEVDQQCRYSHRSIPYLSTVGFREFLHPIPSSRWTSMSLPVHAVAKPLTSILRELRALRGHSVRANRLPKESVQARFGRLFPAGCTRRGGQDLCSTTSGPRRFLFSPQVGPRPQNSEPRIQSAGIPSARNPS